ncbi:hypothetical protein DPMN_150664 [Dreissena polymorpha]|uniref:Uncharacterized protein n=1 Tax=Dreissena polymorpha TaxID=45954 RepID=A0A9D4J5T8_DREPO|nr:hypothetical protein DPMN_150664 [Dreissena polymorpha]
MVTTYQTHMRRERGYTNHCEGFFHISHRNGRVDRVTRGIPKPQTTRSLSLVPDVKLLSNCNSVNSPSAIPFFS